MTLRPPRHSSSLLSLSTPRLEQPTVDRTTHCEKAQLGAAKRLGEMVTPTLKYTSSTSGCSLHAAFEALTHRLLDEQR